jgi:hypothetical protein
MIHNSDKRWFSVISRKEWAFSMTGDVAIVTLYSDFSVEGKGFLLSYVADTNLSAPNVRFSTNIILSETPDANLTYPGDTSNYQNYELSTFVYSPNYTHISSTIQADYVLDGLENGCDCCDFVAVYRFTTIAAAEGRGWSYMER